MDKKIKKVALLAAKKAGQTAAKMYIEFNRKNVSLKTRKETVTQADLKSEKIIIREIKKVFPQHSILSEEAGEEKHKSDYLWIIDPIDGSTNFSFHSPLWAISIGVAHKGKIIFGVVYAPVLGELFWAEQGQGAYLNNKKIRVSKIKDGKVLHTFCHANNKKDMMTALAYYRQQKINALDCRQLGSASLELSYVAAGRLESIYIPGANSYDVAAGVLLVQEAGGKVTNYNNKKWTLESPDMLASNSLVHSQIIKTISKIKK